MTKGKSNNVVYLGYWDSNLNENGALRGPSLDTFVDEFGGVPYTGSYWGELIPTTNYGKYAQ